MARFKQSFFFFFIPNGAKFTLPLELMVEIMVSIIIFLR
jgi:hypothetical protein